MDKQKPNFYAIIPASVRYAKISANAKLLYGEISALTQKEGFCWSGNGYFSKLYDVDPRSVTRWLKELVDIKAIRLVVSQENGNQRKIYLEGVTTKLSIPIDKNVYTPIDKNVLHNNTSNNNTKNTISSASQTDLAGLSSSEAPTPPTPPSSIDKQVYEIGFKRLIAILHPNQKLLFTDTRKAKLKKRNKNFTMAQIVEAAKNLMQSDWHTGKNPDKKKYASYDFLIRNDEQVEKWLNEKPVEQKRSAF